MTAPLSHDEQAAALAEAERVGMAFLVDGVHVPADRIVIVSPPAGMGPIAAMRAEKDEARKVLAQLEEFKADQEFIASRVRRMCNLCSIPIPEGNDAFIASVAGTLLGACCSKLSKFQEDMVRLQRESFEAINGLRAAPFARGGVVKNCACGKRAAYECTEQWGPDCDMGNNPAHVKVSTQPPFSWPHSTPAPGPLAEPVGIDTTDPVQASIVASLPPDSPLLQPITDEPEPGESMSCGVCGALFTGAGLFCPAHS